MLKDHCLAEIPEFGALIQKANESMLPVFGLTKEDMGTVGKVYDSMEEKENFLMKCMKILSM